MKAFVRAGLAAVAVLGLLAAPARAADPAAVEAAAAQAGLGRLAPALAAAARDGVQVRRSVGDPSALAVGASRLGGAPDLPLGVRWPRCRGRPMTFLGQVRAEGLPPSAVLPPTGLLAFFTQVAEDPLRRGRWLWAGDCSAVVHTPPERTVRRRRAPRERPRLVLDPASVLLRADVSLPAPAPGGALAAPLDALRLGATDRRRYAGLRAALREPGFRAHRLLGYPGPAGEDPRAQCAAGAAGTLPAEWQLVLQFDADPELGWSVGGGGRLSILAREGEGLDRRPCSVFDARG